ncbi:hypothetical protein [Vreelandella massiliensis]|uniref:hypothetical protein n=1 Tax=Vreelandella massiliensis TaxID=1816686 RepID=UPI00096A4BB0|nr:hypothetical protein [Halomonas massiliensis]
MLKADFSVVCVTDMLVLIVDNDRGGPSVTNDAANVIERVDAVVGGLARRRVYYRDSDWRFDELVHENGQFKGFQRCTDDQQDFLNDVMASQVSG